MPKMTFDWNELPVSEPVPGFRGRVAHSDTMTFVMWDIAAGAALPEHRHVHEQVAHVIEGQFQLTVEGLTAVIEPGMLATIPSNALHSGLALTDCRILDVFSPVREDYRDGLTSRVISGTASA